MKESESIVITLNHPIRVEFLRHDNEDKWHITHIDIPDPHYQSLQDAFENQMILEAARKKFGHGDDLVIAGGEERDGKHIVWFVVTQYGEEVDRFDAIVTWKDGKVELKEV